MKIYTKTGDDGNTGLQGDFRIAKSHPRILAYGTVDEANAMTGVVLTNVLDDDVRDVLSSIQGPLQGVYGTGNSDYGGIVVAFWFRNCPLGVTRK